MNIQDQYRASYIHRWGIVKVDRRQNIAEHSFNVAVIARKLLEAVYPDAPDCVRIAVMDWAILHDIPEVMTGDLSTPLKKQLEKLSPGALKKIEANISPEWLEAKERAGKSCAIYIVKLADTLEAYKFLDDNCTTAHGAMVKKRLYRSFHGTLKYLEESFHNDVFNWAGAAMMAKELCDGEETYFDDILDEWNGEE